MLPGTGQARVNACKPPPTTRVRLVPTPLPVTTWSMPRGRVPSGGGVGCQHSRPAPHGPQDTSSPRARSAAVVLALAPRSQGNSVKRAVSAVDELRASDSRHAQH